MTSTLYRGSVKNLIGPIKSFNLPALIFEYTDAFSVFDWGRMPDLLSRKGEALAIMAADLFEKLEKPQTWRDFSKSPEALALRKANRFGAAFNEIGEELQSKGLRTHYLGVLDNLTLVQSTSTHTSVADESLLVPKKLSDQNEPFRRMVVKQVSAVKPTLSSVLGRIVPDYDPTRRSPLPRLIPLEVIFRLSCPAGSSLVSRMEKDTGYLASLGFSETVWEPGAKWDFPILELFTKLESSDRVVSFGEALAISGITAKQLQETLLKTSWLAGLLKYQFSRLGLELADGKLEWALSENGDVFLVDAIGLDELRVMKNGMSLSKEFLRTYYRNTSWYSSLQKAKDQAKIQGVEEWKRFVSENPPTLPQEYRELAMQVYLSLTNGLTGRKWFAEAWSLEKVVSQLQGFQEGN